MLCVGIDGESISPWGYCLLSSSAPDSLRERRRLTSQECFEFILDQYDPGTRLFGYGIGYDVCHWVADLSDKQKTRLATKGVTQTNQGGTFYRLRYVPNAYFTIQKLGVLPGSKVTAQATVVDLMRWHRRPFVDVCEEWFPNALVYSHVKDFKAKREDFREKDTVSIIAYCDMECRLLERLGNEMTSRLSDLGIPVSHPFTAGAVAGALMAKNKVQNHWQEPPEGVRDAVSRAFFGGREQCSRYGYFEKVTQWDIRSAYGWAMTQLPDMLGGWERDQTGENLSSHSQYPWSLYKVQWDLDEGKHPVMPFPWRDENGRVHYPPRGTGWQWSPIVRAALRNYKGSSIKIVDAWHYIPLCNRTSPFSYVGDLYAHRREAANDPVGGLLKSLIVATWGRMCSSGLRKSKTRGQLDWAGMTTALIQERMIDAVHSTGEQQFLSCCVDGFWTTSDKAPLGEGGALGEWGSDRADELLLLRPACYWKSTNGEWTAHTSGIPGGARLVDAALEEWRSAGWKRGIIELNQRRCKGLLACSSEGNYDQLGQFVDLPLKVTFNPGQGRTGHECPTLKHGKHWRRWLSYWPPSAAITTESDCFKSRTGLVDDRWKERQEANAIEETSE